MLGVVSDAAAAVTVVTGLGREMEVVLVLPPSGVTEEDDSPVAADDATAELRADCDR